MIIHAVSDVRTCHLSLLWPCLYQHDGVTAVVGALLWPHSLAMSRLDVLPLLRRHNERSYCKVLHVRPIKTFMPYRSMRPILHGPTLL